MKLNPKQKEFYKESNARLNIATGSVRSGKSAGMNVRLLKAFLEPRGDCPPDAIDVLVGKTLSSLKRNMVMPIISLVGSRNAVYYPGKQEFHLLGNVIHVFGANDDRSENKIRGSTIRKAGGDELTLWPESFFNMLVTRLSTRQSQFFGTTNPGAPRHYLKKDYINRKEELGLNVFEFRLDDNLWLLENSPEYVEQIKTTFTGLWYKRFILGEWCMAEGAVYDFFDEDQHTIVANPKADYYILGVDFGVSNATCFLLAGVKDGKCWVEHEYYYNPVKEMMQKTVGEYADDFVAFCKEHLGVYWQTMVRGVYIDPAAEAFRLELERKHVFSLMDAENEVIDGLTTTANMMKTGKLSIHTRCKNLIEEVFSYSWDSKSQEKGIDQPLKKDDHAVDALRYLAYSHFGPMNVDISAFSKR